MPSKKVDNIEVANSKSLEQFIDDYLPPREQWKTWTHPKTKEEYEISIQTAKMLSQSDFDSCFHLIEFTSSADYKNSKDGWKPRSKRKEMKLLDLKYILVKRNDQVEGFASLMPTYEDDIAVIYCYEVHLSSALQGTGLGTVLMKFLDEIGVRIYDTEKVMLTCFTANARGVKFYEKLGLEKDEFSPPPKLLRNGTKVECEYVILSKAIR